MMPSLSKYKWRRGLHLLALAMPMGVLVLFCLTMLSAVLSCVNTAKTPTNFTASIMLHPQYTTDPSQGWQGLVGLIGFGMIVTPVIGALVLNVVRTVWLYVRTWRHSCSAGDELQAIVRANLSLRGQPSIKVEVRVWYSSKPFAFNLPGIWPGRNSVIVVSSGLIAQLEVAELEAVIWHELAHLAEQDFWWKWLATWCQLAFFYLLDGRYFLALLEQTQELACDEQVSRLGGLPKTLALADALLKVWEYNLSIGNDPNRGKLSSSIHFQAPALAAKNLSPSLTEQRINRLIELGSTQKEPGFFIEAATRQTQTKFLVLVMLSLFLWFVITVSLHFICPILG